MSSRTETVAVADDIWEKVMKLLAVPRYRLNAYGVGPFQLRAPQSGTLSRISSRTRPSVQTLLYVCLKRIGLLDTSAFSALEVLDRGGSRSIDWRGPYGERGARAYNGGLGLCPQQGPGAEPLVRGAKPP